MKLLSTLIAAFSLLVGFATADKPFLTASEGMMVGYSCAYMLSRSANLYNESVERELYYGEYCNIENQPALGSFALCIMDGFNPADTQAGIAFMLDYCKSYNLTREQLDDGYENATHHQVDIFNNPKYNHLTVLYNPVSVNKTVLAPYYNTYVNYYSNYNWTTWFSTALISYWFAVFIVAGICNYAYFLFPKFINRTFNGTISKKFRKYISLPATFRQSHATPVRFLHYFMWLLPTRLESILMFIWFILALAFNIAHIYVISPNMFWPEKNAQLGRTIGARSGIIAVFLIPVNILLAGRNNFLLWLSGWPQSRMLYLHRWTSRVMFVEVAIHSAAEVAYFVAEHEFASFNAENYVVWGYVGTIAGAILCIHSVLALRRSNYEIFLAIHIIFAAIFLVGGYYHCLALDDEDFYYCAIAVWSFDRLVRFVRLFHFGVQNAEIELKANELIKVTVPRPKSWKPFPGCFAYVHFIRPTCFWQSHPFTVVDTEFIDGSQSISFYVKVKGGMTHGLLQYLSKQPDQRASIKVMVEGPYGNRVPIDRYDNAVFVAGGYGIPGLYATAADIIKRESCITKVIKFHWVVSNWSSIKWFRNELKKFENKGVDFTVYITRPEIEFSSSEEEKVSKDFEDNQSSSLLQQISNLREELSFIDFREGRPRVEAIFKQSIEELDGTIAISTCARSNMVDELRRAIVNNIESTKDRVDYFEEIQVW